MVEIEKFLKKMTSKSQRKMVDLKAQISTYEVLGKLREYFSVALKKEEASGSEMIRPRLV